MTQDDEYYNKTSSVPSGFTNLDDDREDGGEVEGGDSQGGKSGQIEFHDFLSPGESRDDLLSFDEKRHLLLIHKDGNEIRVKKAKDLRAARLELREKVGKFLQSGNRYGYGGMGGEMNPYKPNPALVDEAQFSGIDKQTSPVATDYIAETNEAERQEPENQYRLRYQPELAPRFHPTPQQNTKLTRS